MVKLIRHAQSTFNAFGDKSPDCEITPEGRNMAKGLDGTYDLVICSTLRRCRQTLDASDIRYSNLMFSELCREVRDGNPVNLYNGESLDLLKESDEGVQQRLEDFKNLLRDLSTKYEKIAVMTHYEFLKRLTGYSFNNCFWWDYTVPGISTA